MIGLTRTNGEPCRLHPADIQRIENHPCTVVFLTDGAKYAVVEDVDEIVRRVSECRARAMTCVYRLADEGRPSASRLRAAGVRPARVMPFASRQES